MTKVPAKLSLSSSSSAEGGSEETFVHIPSANVMIVACLVNDHMEGTETEPCGIPPASFFVGVDSLSSQLFLIFAIVLLIIDQEIVSILVTWRQAL